MDGLENYFFGFFLDKKNLENTSVSGWKYIGAGTECMRHDHKWAFPVNLKNELRVELFLLS